MRCCLWDARAQFDAVFKWFRRICLSESPDAATSAHVLTPEDSRRVARGLRTNAHPRAPVPAAVAAPSSGLGIDFGFGLGGSALGGVGPSCMPLGTPAPGRGATPGAGVATGAPGSEHADWFLPFPLSAFLTRGPMRSTFGAFRVHCGDRGEGSMNSGRFGSRSALMPLAAVPSLADQLAAVGAQWRRLTGSVAVARSCTAVASVTLAPVPSDRIVLASYCDSDPVWGLPPAPDGPRTDSDSDSGSGSGRPGLPAVHRASHVLCLVPPAPTPADQPCCVYIVRVVSGGLGMGFPAFAAVLPLPGVAAVVSAAFYGKVRLRARLSAHSARRMFRPYTLRHARCALRG
jgi:hypothetical protein